MVVKGLTIAAVALALLAASSPVAEAAPKRFFGVSASPDYSTLSLQRLADGGVTSVRTGFVWALVEPTQGTRDWRQLDSVVSNAATAGIQLMPFVYGSPQWVTSNRFRPPVYGSGEARAGWRSFLHDLAARYGRSGTFWTLNPHVPQRPIVHWQIWNEVNLSFYWGGRPDPKRYAALLRLSRRGLRSGDPKARIVTAGLLPYRSRGRGNLHSGKYLRRLLRARGAKKLFDVVAIHPYGSSPKLVLKRMIESRQTLNRLRLGKKPLWATEFGWATGGDNFNSSPVRATPPQQARRLSKTYKLLGKQARRLRLRRAFYFNAQDTKVPGPSVDWSARMGMFDVNGTPKPAWFAYAKRAGGTP